MFRKTKDIKPNSDDIANQFSARRKRFFSKPDAWHNVFYDNVTSKIPEELFSVLYDEKIWRPNIPISLFMWMLILKEGHWWSDEQLFEHVQFNVLVMKALWLVDLRDEVPAMSTYYLFKQRLYNYQEETGTDLIWECFLQLTGIQAKIFWVTGEHLRMDSKLIWSNIAVCSRLQLVMDCIKKFYKGLRKEKKQQITEEDNVIIKQILKESSWNAVFRLTNQEKKEYLEELWNLLMRLQETYDEDDSEWYNDLVRIFKDQFSIWEDIIAKEGKDISPNSLQSVHDVDATYRKKWKQKVHWYSVNVTETCNKEGVNLITDIILDKSTRADCNFLKDALESSEKVVGNIGNSYQDGAYNSKENNEFWKDKNINLYYTGIQGKRWRFSPKIDKDDIFITDTKDGNTYLALILKSGNCKIQIKEGDEIKSYYFKKDAIDTALKRDEVDSLPKEIKNIRPNVEATIFQISFRLRNNKTRYRGSYKNSIQLTCRAMWINLRRIQIGGVCLKAKKGINIVKNGYIIKLINYLSFLKNTFWDITYVFAKRINFPIIKN